MSRTADVDRASRAIRRWLVPVAFWAVASAALAAPVHKTLPSALTQSGLSGLTVIRTDLDGDNQSDRISFSSDGHQVSVNIFLSATDRQTCFHFASTVRQIGILACDFTDDGALDLIFTNEARLRPIALCVNRGDGTFDVHPCDGQMDDGFLPDLPLRDHALVAVVPSRTQRLKHGVSVLCSVADALPVLRCDGRPLQAVPGIGTKIGYSQEPLPAAHRPAVDGSSDGFSPISESILRQDLIWSDAAFANRLLYIDTAACWSRPTS